MNRELDRILKDPETVQRLRALGFFTEGAETPRRWRRRSAPIPQMGGIVKESESSRIGPP